MVWELLPTMDAFSRRYQTIWLHLVIATMVVTIAVECEGTDSNRDNCTWPSTAPPGAIPGVDINNRRTEPVEGLPGSLCEDSTHFVQELIWRCEERFCCNQTCTCDNFGAYSEDSNCPGDATGTLAPQVMECYVQHHTTRDYIMTCCPGYEEQDIADTLTCVDTDECTNVTTCPPPMICQNLPGTYSCVCAPGFVMSSNGTCLDINECGHSGSGLPDISGCSHGCINLSPLYRCTCPENMTIDITDMRTCKEDSFVGDVTPLAAVQKSGGSSPPVAILVVLPIVGLLLLLGIIFVVFLMKRKRKPPPGGPGVAYDNNAYGTTETPSIIPSYPPGKSPVAFITDDNDDFKKKPPIDDHMVSADPLPMKKSIPNTYHDVEASGVYMEPIPDLKDYGKSKTSSFSDSKDVVPEIEPYYEVIPRSTEDLPAPVVLPTLEEREARHRQRQSAIYQNDDNSRNEIIESENVYSEIEEFKC